MILNFKSLESLALFIAAWENYGTGGNIVVHEETPTHFTLEITRP